MHQSSGIHCWHNDAWNIRARAGAVSDDVSLSNLALILFSPVALLGFKWLGFFYVNIYIAYWIAGILFGLMVCHTCQLRIHLQIVNLKF